MRPKERRDSGQSDLFRARLDQIVDIRHPLAKLATAIDWRFLEERFGAVYSDKPGQPPLPTRLTSRVAHRARKTVDVWHNVPRNRHLKGVSFGYKVHLHIDDDQRATRRPDRIVTDRLALSADDTIPD